MEKFLSLRYKNYECIWFIQEISNVKNIQKINEPSLLFLAFNNLSLYILYYRLNYSWSNWKVFKDYSFFYELDFQLISDEYFQIVLFWIIANCWMIEVLCPRSMPSNCSMMDDLLHVNFCRNYKTKSFLFNHKMFIYFLTSLLKTKLRKFYKVEGKVFPIRYFKVYGY